MTNRKSISIAMATYNGETFLSEQLDSISRQTYLPCELVICDDGSTDDTLAIVADYAKNARFDVRVSRNDERLGHRRNFHKCATLCHGDLIAFCDQDDIWREDKLSVQLTHFDESPGVLLSYHNAQLIDQDGSWLGRTLYRRTNQRLDEFRTVSKYAASYGFTQLFRRELLLFSDFMPTAVDMYDDSEIILHDHWYYLLAIILGSAHYDPACLAYYRRHATNASPNVPMPSERIRRKFIQRRGQFDRMVEVSTNWRNVSKRSPTPFNTGTITSKAVIFPSVH